MHNQPIERHWRTTRTHVSERFRRIFLQMEQDGILNIMDQCDLDALRYAYLPVIQRELNVFREAHNKGAKRGKRPPAVLYNRAEAERECDVELEEIHIPSRLPFSSETIDLRNRMVESMGILSTRQQYVVAAMANKLLLQDLMNH